MGTQWKGDVKLRYERTREVAQRKAEMETGQPNTASNSTGGESAVVSPDDSGDSNARSRLRRKTATLAGANHGVRSILQA